jgi:hypothetical protein
MKRQLKQLSPVRHCDEEVQPEQVFPPVKRLAWQVVPLGQSALKTSVPPVAVLQEERV